jgi:hypothetical protein
MVVQCAVAIVSIWRVVCVHYSGWFEWAGIVFAGPEMMKHATEKVYGTSRGKVALYFIVRAHCTCSIKTLKSVGRLLVKASVLCPHFFLKVVACTFRRRMHSCQYINMVLITYGQRESHLRQYRWSTPIFSSVWIRILYSILTCIL